MNQEFRTYNRSYRHQPDFFFPIALITAGIVWLLVNNGTIPVDNLYRLAPLWPGLLILAGLGLMTRRIWWPVNALMWAVVGALVVWLLTSGSAYLPKLSPLELKHETLHETLGQTTSADVRLDLSIQPVTVRTLVDSQDLLVADVYTINGMILDASGGAQKNIHLHESPAVNNFVFNTRIDQWLQASSKPWDIRLSPNVPISLTVDAGTGGADMKLDGLKLTSLRVNAGTGRLDVALPQSKEPLSVRIDMGTGGTGVRMPSDTPVELTVHGGTGGLEINLPEGAGVRVDVRNSGLGGLHLPSSFTKTSGDSKEKEGLWQNEAYSTSKTPITIILDIGTGGVTIH
jgi:hypothetical protein